MFAAGGHKDELPECPAPGGHSDEGLALAPQTRWLRTRGEVMPNEPVIRRREARHAEMPGAPKARLLLVLAAVPWPVRRTGYALRFAPIIDYLAQRHELDVLVLAEGDEVVQRSGPLQRCHSLVVTKVPTSRLPPWLRKIRTACRALWPWGPPRDSAGFPTRKLERLLLDYLDDKNYSAVIWATRFLDTACRIRRRYPESRFVIDMVDSRALLSSRDASTSSPLLRTLNRYSGWKWRRLERKAQEVFDASIYISNVDAHAARAGHMPRIHVVPNGIFHADAPPMAKAAPSSRVIGFLGGMSYQPNISAVLRLAERIFPRILASLADAKLLIIGRDPVPEIRRLQSPAITVTGTVDNVWPWITRANVFVYPMIEGAGLQNKILEAMYAGVPIVTTSIAANGIGARNGEQLLVADTDDGIVEHVVRLLGDPESAARLADQARSFVMREFSWPAILPRYEAIVVTASNGCRMPTGGMSQ
jgi:glycosyltransferase involved in cell wall biosynthesis